jgi:putative transposase
VIRYEPTRPDDGALRQRLRKLAAERRRFGYRRLGYLLAREGIAPNHKKLLRIYREEGLKVRRRSGRKRALGTRAPMTIPQRPNQRWSLDFVFDAFVCGRRFRILCVIDDYSRECVALVTDTSVSGARVARELDTAIMERMAKPVTVVSDNGTELTSMAILKWSKDRKVDWHYTAPGKPTQNAFVERLGFARLRLQRQAAR